MIKSTTYGTTRSDKPGFHPVTAPKKLRISAVSTAAILTASTLLSTAVPMETAWAGEPQSKQETAAIPAKTNPQSAAGQPAKDEVIYVNLQSNGAVKDVNVVNIFDGISRGTITDYGNYGHLRNMTTEDEINYQNGTIRIKTDAEKLYYQGTQADTKIPWTFDLRYALDGRECTAEKLIGQNGHLQLTLSVIKNPQYRNPVFFENCALQISVTLDSNLCTNIQTKGATIANVGGNKQLTYTIMPGTEKDFTITADVTDFQMQEIAINGLPLSLDVEIDDKDLMSQVDQLTDGISALDAGASGLQSGTAKLQRGVQTELQPGASALSKGTGQLKQGAATLKNGGAALYQGVSGLNGGVSDLEQGAHTLETGITQIESGLVTLNNKSESLTTGSAQIKAALKEIRTAINGVSASFEEVRTLLDASAAIKGGIKEITDSIETLENSTSYEAYLTAMDQNGLDIKALQSKNTEAIQTLRETIDALQKQLESLETLGDTGTVLPSAAPEPDTASSDETDAMPAETTAAAGNTIDETIAQIKEQIAQLEATITLLSGNNAAIDGTKAYFDTLHQNILPLKNGAKQLQTQYDKFHQTLGFLITGLENLSGNVTQLSTAMNRLLNQYNYLDDGIRQYTDGVAKLLAGQQKVAAGARTLVSGTNTLHQGTAALDQGTNQLLSGISAFYQATGTLDDGSGKLNRGVKELLTGITLLHTGSGELKDGTRTLKDRTSGMDDQVQEKIDNLLDEVTGSPEKLTSFTSEKNKNIDAVQFVIKTAPLEPEEKAAPVEEPKEKLSFWQKLRNLFPF